MVRLIDADAIELRYSFAMISDEGIPLWLLQM